MSLVAYDDSSDESDSENSTTSTVEIPTVTKNAQKKSDFSDNNSSGKLSSKLEDVKRPEFITNGGRLQLPPPKKRTNSLNSMSLETTLTNSSIFDSLPKTSSSTLSRENLKNLQVEEDDEFLHIRPQSYRNKDDINNEIVNSSSTKTQLLAASKTAKRPQQIFIPSLKDFDDVEDTKPKPIQINKAPVKLSGLLDILPKVQQRSQQNSKILPTNNKLMVPKSVANRSNLNRKTNELQIPNNVSNTTKGQSTSVCKDNQNKSISNSCSESEHTDKKNIIDMNDSESDADTDDDQINAANFFSLDDNSIKNTNDGIKSVQICEEELNDLISKRAAEMKKAKEAITDYTGSISKTIGESSNLSSMIENTNVEENVNDVAPQYDFRNENTCNEGVLDSKALEELVGSRGKRKRYNMDYIEVINLSGEKVLPDRDEWMRSALATSTTDDPNARRAHKQPRGHTKRRHQITYLMDHAIANDADLQAMWAANQQTRRITSGKYGF